MDSMTPQKILKVILWDLLIALFSGKHVKWC